MADQIVRDAVVWVAQYDLSGNVNALALNCKAETPDATAMGDLAKVRLGGLKDHAAEINGWFEAALVTGNPDHYLFDRMALAFPAMSLSPLGTTNALAYLLKPELIEYSPGAKVGDVFPFKVHAEGAGVLVKGTILLPKLARIVTATSAPVNRGAVSAAQRVYAALHVFGASAGDTLDVIIQSDSLVGFGTPADVITFAQKTAAGYEWAEAAGPNTDIWWRVSFTIGGVDPSFTFAVTMGIL